MRIILIRLDVRHNTSFINPRRHQAHISVLGLSDKLLVDANKREYVLVPELAPDESFTEEFLTTVLQSVKNTLAQRRRRLCEQHFSLPH
jgi:hypothetical protein